MPFTNTIVNYINERLIAATSASLKPMRAYNVSTPVTRMEGSSTMVFPGIIAADGEITEITPDDVFNIMLYHKITGNTYTQRKIGSYGDTMDFMCVSDMQIIVFALSDKIQMTAEQLEPHIVFGLPVGISNDLAGELRIKQCTIAAVSSDMDKMRTFRSEYQNVQNFLAPEHILFSVRYTITKIFDRSCIDLCLSCNQQLN